MGNAASFQTRNKLAKIVCVLFDDPVDGYPPAYARDDLPEIDHYPGGQTVPTPKAIDFKPGTLLGSVSGELGLRKYLDSLGHQLVVSRTRTTLTPGSSMSWRRRNSDLPALLARLSDRRAHRQSSQTQARNNRRHRFRSRRSPGGNRSRHHHGRGGPIPTR
jgi:hypothetical protein